LFIYFIGFLKIKTIIAYKIAQIIVSPNKILFCGNRINAPAIAITVSIIMVKVAPEIT